MANVADRLLKLHYSETLLETLVMACFMNSMFIPKQMKMISPFFFQNIDGTSFGIWYFLTIKERLASWDAGKQSQLLKRGMGYGLDA